MQFLGTQILLELVGAPHDLLDDVDFVREAMTDAARRAGLTVVGELFHRFNPQGVSGVVVIAESHIAIHTWPERGYASIDLYTCGEVDGGKLAADFLTEAFQAAHCSRRVLRRGLVPGAGAAVEPAAELTEDDVS